MKRIFCVLLTTLTLLSLWGCSSEETGKKVSIPENITFTAEIVSAASAQTTVVISGETIS